jgi:hypothetical protein
MKNTKRRKQKIKSNTRKNKYIKQKRAMKGGTLGQNATPEELYRGLLGMVQIWNQRQDLDAYNLINSFHETIFPQALRVNGNETLEQYQRIRDEQRDYFLNPQTSWLNIEVGDFKFFLLRFVGSYRLKAYQIPPKFQFPMTFQEYLTWRQRNNGNFDDLIYNYKTIAPMP